MRPLRALVIYIAVVFLGGSLLAPWLYGLTPAGAAGFPKLADWQVLLPVLFNLALIGLFLARVRRVVNHACRLSALATSGKTIPAA